MLECIFFFLKTSLQLHPAASSLHMSCLTYSCPHYNLVTNTAHASRGAARADSCHSHVLSASFNTPFIRQHTAGQRFRVKAGAAFIFTTLFKMHCYFVQLSILASEASKPDFVCVCRRRWLTSTQVSMSWYWFIIGRMVSMLLCSTRSDLFPTRINGTLQENLSLLTYIRTTESADFKQFLHNMSYCGSRHP